MGKDARARLRAVDAPQQGQTPTLSVADFDRLKSKQCDVLQVELDLLRLQSRHAAAVKARTDVLDELARAYGFDPAKSWTLNDDRTLTLVGSLP